MEDFLISPPISNLKLKILQLYRFLQTLTNKKTTPWRGDRSRAISITTVLKSISFLKTIGSNIFIH